MIRFVALVLLPLNCLAATATGSASQADALLGSWLKAQARITSWSADFTQTRALKSLAQPLTATGHVWFVAPNQFRWELGHPAQTIAVRAPRELLVIYPKLRRVERFPLGGEQAGPWRDALQLLEAGFPRSQTELEAQYEILNENVKDDTCEIAMRPKSASARKLMPRLTVLFGAKDFGLRGTELQFADGSTMRNDFTNAILNPKIDAQLFSPELPGDFKVVEPLKNN